MLDYFTTAQAPRPNSSTIPVPHGKAQLLYELDDVSQHIIETIFAHLKDNASGTPLIFREYNRTLELFRFVGLSELQRHRRLFVKVNSQHPPTSSAEIGRAFIDFLVTQI